MFEPSRQLLERFSEHPTQPSDARPRLTIVVLQLHCNYVAVWEDTITESPAPAPGPTRDDIIAPLGGLPAPEPVELEANFIDLAVAEVRFDVPPIEGKRATTVTTPQGLAVRELAAHNDVHLPSVEPTERQETRLDLTPTGPVAQASTSLGVQLSSADRTLAISVFTDLITVQHTDYGRFGKSLRPALRAALTGVQQQLAPDTVRRVGLRYINRLVDTEARTPTDWVGRIRPSVLGILTEEAVSARIQSTQQQIQFDFGDASGATVRHGAFADPAVHGAYSYVVDLDVYSQVTDRFDAEQVMATVRQLNVTALSLFQWIVLPEWRATMRPTAIERSTPDAGGSTPETAAADSAPDDAMDSDS